MRTLPTQHHSKPVTSNSDGFTIVELMIATVIFSLILLILTYGVLQITRTYYKGITSANTQNTARNIIDNVSQAVQFSGKDTAYVAITPAGDGTQGFCIGNQRYSYLSGYQLVSGTANHSLNQTNYAFVVDTFPGCTTTSAALGLLNALPGTPSALPAVDKELMGMNMRLAYFSPPAASADNLYNIHIRVVYGDNDLLCSQTALAGSCNSSATMPSTDYVESDLSCKGQAGDQFCAVSDLNTIVQKRLQ